MTDNHSFFERWSRVIRETPRTTQEKVDHGMAILDSLADQWAEEVDLTSMIKNAVSPMRLNRNAPKKVRDEFTARMERQIYAIVRQTYIEASYRTLCQLQDETAARRSSEGDA